MPAKVVELVDVQTMRGQIMLTRYHYMDADGVADQAVLVSDYLADVVPRMAAFQSNTLTHVAIRVRQVYPVALLQQETPINPGIVGSDPAVAAESFNTFSIKFNLGPTVQLGGSDGGHISRGGKHLPGVTTGEISGDTPISGAVQDLINAYIVQAKDPGTDPWQLVVASFETGKSHKVKVGTVTTITRPAPSPIVTKYALVVGASNASISTQNTRKVLRGRTY